MHQLGPRARTGASLTVGFICFVICLQLDGRNMVKLFLNITRFGIASGNDQHSY